MSDIESYLRSMTFDYLVILLSWADTKNGIASSRQLTPFLRVLAMAILKRHWKLTVINLLLCLAAGFGLMFYVHGKSTAAPAVASALTPQPRQQIDPILFSRVARLRTELRLTTPDLATMGFERNKAREVIFALASWCRTNGDALASAERGKFAADRALRNGMRASSPGAMHRTDAPSLAQLKLASSAAEMSFRNLHDSAIQTLLPLLNTPQAAPWRDRHTKSPKELLAARAARIASVSPVNTTSISVSPDTNGTDPAIALFQAQQALAGIDDEVLPMPVRLAKKLRTSNLKLR